MTYIGLILDAGSTPAASTIFVKRTNYDYGFKMYKHLEETNMTYMQRAMAAARALEERQRQEMDSAQKISSIWEIDLLKESPGGGGCRRVVVFGFFFSVDFWGWRLSQELPPPKRESQRASQRASERQRESDVLIVSESQSLRVSESHNLRV